MNHRSAFNETETDSPAARVPDSKPRPVNCPARVKALDPVTSTCPPSHVRVIEYAQKSIKLEANRYFLPGTLLQLNVERNFSLWKVRTCVPHGSAFHIGLELAEILHPFAQEIRLEQDAGNRAAR